MQRPKRRAHEILSNVVYGEVSTSLPIPVPSARCRSFRSSEQVGFDRGYEAQRARATSSKTCLWRNRKPVGRRLRRERAGRSLDSIFVRREWCIGVKRPCAGGWQGSVRHGGLPGAPLECVAPSYGTGDDGNALHADRKTADERPMPFVKLRRYREAASSIPTAQRREPRASL